MFPWQQQQQQQQQQTARNEAVTLPRPSTPPSALSHQQEEEEKKDPDADEQNHHDDDGNDAVDKSLLQPSAPETAPTAPQTPSSVASTDVQVANSQDESSTSQPELPLVSSTSPLNPLWTDASQHVGYRQLMTQWTTSTLGGSTADDATAVFRLEDYCALPLICVMGDTSSGKSTILSQLTGIALPAHCQLTTKCPTVLQLQPSCDDKTATTTAKVSIQWHASTRKRFANQKKDPIPTFPPRTVTDWQELPRVILQAQTFLLQATSRAVAPDRVIVNVSGPTCPQLTLVDLPGTVHQAAAHESHTLPTEINAVLDDYWNNPQAIFLVVVPSNVDFHNAALLAQALQRAGPHRTVPVLTKPDLIDTGAETAVMDLLTGVTPLQSSSSSSHNDDDARLAFHMVKGRGQAALDRQDSLSTALEHEQEYFDQTEPWQSIADRSLLGTTHLRSKLAQRQFLQVQKAVGPALQRLRSQHAAVMASLQEMGVPVTTPVERRRLYQEVCQTFATQLQATLSGKGRAKGKRNNNSSNNVAPNTPNLSAAASLHEACRDFMNKISQGSLATIQRVVEGAHVLVTSGQGTIRGEVVHLDVDFCCVDYVDEKDAQSAALFEVTQQTCLESIEENDVWSDGTNIYVARSNHMFDTLRKIPLSCVRTDPSWLKERMAEHRTDDLACFLNVDVFQNIVQDFIEVDWRPHCLEFLECLGNILQTAIQGAWQATLTNCSVGRYPSLQAFVLRECNGVQTDLLQNARQQVESHLRVEQHPYTQDDLLFRNLAAARQQSLRQELEVALGLNTGKDVALATTTTTTATAAALLKPKVLSTTAITEIIDDVFNRHKSQPVEDHLAAEMEMVLASYGQIATRRVIDRAPMIGWEVFRSLTTALQESLWSVTDDKLKECFRDETDLVRQYESLSRQEKSLTKAISIFQAVPLPSLP